MDRRRRDETARDADRLMSISETAGLYGVEDATISAWLQRQDPRLPRPIRFGRYVRFRRRDVLDRIAAIADGNVAPMRRA
jgi:predicted DNA-binding transcriptional regulator AlpA